MEDRVPTLIPRRLLSRDAHVHTAITAAPATVILEPMLSRFLVKDILNHNAIPHYPNGDNNPSVSRLNQDPL